MFTKVLVANRGEIALRVIRTCQEMGITAVAVHSQADAGALHVLAADEAYCIGPPPTAESYLDGERIIQVARECGAQAIHPGYGFLSENAAFARACQEAGLVFIGPGAEAIGLLGDKSTAKALARSANLPLIPGYYGPEQEDGSLSLRARDLGFPLLVKASAGGGGRGMRLVRDPEQLGDALAAARREALAGFGDGTLMLERYLEGARHVEVQVMGDSLGTVVHLGERECSLQRRYQKVVEECPSPAVDGDLRQAMGEAAVRLARAGGYTNAGTVEFLLDDQGRFYFLEMNTRLQVEHPVTEMVTGWDLVRLQLLVASGRPLPFSQEDLVLRGHAIEARIYAEDPSQGYLPQTGRLLRYVSPVAPWVRNDVGVRDGSEITSHYDALLGKLIVYGQDRSTAMERLRWALHSYVVTGVGTNLDLLKAIASDEDFAAGRTNTRTIPDRIEPLLAPASQVPAEALAVAGVLRLDLTRSQSGDPWRFGPWRLGNWGVDLDFSYQGQPARVTATRRPGSGWEARVGERVFQVQVGEDPDGRTVVHVDGVVHHPVVDVRDGVLHLLWRGKRYVLEQAGGISQRGQDRATRPSLAGGTVTAPIPGKVIAMRVEEGDRVSAQQTVAVLEAMKMENLVVAPYSGVVRRVHAHEGDQVAKGAPLVELEPA